MIDPPVPTESRASPELPSGTVTFLFTDLEGSSRLLEAHPAAYRDAVARHHALLRHARVRQIVWQTRSLPLARQPAGWSRLQVAYLTLGDDEARELMRHVRE